MHNTKHNILHTKLLLLLLLLVSCGSKDNGNSADIEQQGQQWLNKARTALSDSNYALARQCIDSLRTRSAEAFNAREEGILLLDSIELAEARVELAAAEPESIQRPTGEDGMCLEQVLADPGQEDLFERLALRQALEQLAPKERRVILLRYFHGLTQQRIADLLGVSQVQVSRMEKRALGHLRENL